MSGGWRCECGDREHWVVVQYRENRSLFNGGRRTYSEYSEVKCRRCRARWRTKAAYVEGLTVEDW